MLFLHDRHEAADGGRVILTVAPAAAVISLADCKSKLGITDTSLDVAIQAAIDAVTAQLDAASGGWLGRALRPQSWQLQLRSFRHRYGGRRNVDPWAIPLPYPPLISVDSVKYLDINGNDTTLVLGTDYRVLGMGAVYQCQAIAPLYGATWPVPRIDEASVRISFTAGYTPGPPDALPPQILGAACLGVRAILPMLSRDPTLWEDNVMGVGYKRYQNNPLMADIINKAIQALLINMAM